MALSSIQIARSTYPNRVRPLPRWVSHKESQLAINELMTAKCQNLLQYIFYLTLDHLCANISFLFFLIWFYTRIKKITCVLILITLCSWEEASLIIIFQSQVILKSILKIPSKKLLKFHNNFCTDSNTNRYILRGQSAPNYPNL